MQIYLAGKFSNQAMMRSYRDLIQGISSRYLVRSSWLEEVPPDGYELDYVFQRSVAKQDIVEVQICDLFIMDVTGEQSPGRNVELGVALAAGVDVFIVGEGTSIFYELANKKFESWNGCLEYLREVGRCTDFYNDMPGSLR